MISTATRGLSLLGFLDEAGVNQYLTNICGTKFASDGDWRKEYEKARNRDKALPGANPGRPLIEEIPQAHLEYLAQIGAPPTALNGLSWSFRMVSIRDLICSATHVNLNVVEKYEQAATGGFESILSTCLPKNSALELEARLEQVGSTLSFTGLTNDLGASVILTPDCMLRPMRSRFVEVTMFQGKCVLTDGFHRALALLRTGREFVPAVVKELDPSLNVEPHIRTDIHFKPQLLLADSPPLMAHFMEGHGVEIPLSPAVRVLRMLGESIVVRTE